jgi:hypothetical protein
MRLAPRTTATTTASRIQTEMRTLVEDHHRGVGRFRQGSIANTKSDVNRKRCSGLISGQRCTTGMSAQHDLLKAGRVFFQDGGHRLGWHRFSKWPLLASIV